MIRFLTKRPRALLSAFEKAIEDGDIRTWEKDADGDYLHKASQFTGRGWMRPEVRQGEALRFYFISAKNETQPRLIYSYLHSKMLESFLNHLSTNFTDARQTPNPDGADSTFS